MNVNYFDEINNDEKAYIIGFFLGDGHICNIKNNDYGIIFSQSEKDKDVLDFIKDQICPEAIIKEEKCPSGYGSKNKQFVLRITSKTLHSGLSKITNCTNHKTYESFHLPKKPFFFFSVLSSVFLPEYDSSNFLSNSFCSEFSFVGICTTRFT